MSRNKRMQNIREAKDRRAKRLAIGGGVVLAILLAWEMPHYLGGGKKSAAPAATTTALSTTESGTPPATTTPGVVAAAATPTTSTKLPNSDMTPKHSKQQLTGFSTFASKDPFVQQVTADTAAAAAATAGAGSTTPPSSTAPQKSKPKLTAARTLAQSGAVRISVNGTPQSVRVGASFPSSNPVFRLVSVTSGGVRIGIADGSYSSGAQTVSLGFNKTVTLVDTANGAHYRLQLLGS